MDQAELNTLKSWLAGEVERRRKLGSYNQDAESILNLFAICLKLADHVKPDKKK